MCSRASTINPVFLVYGSTAVSPIQWEPLLIDMYVGTQRSQSDICGDDWPRRSWNMAMWGRRITNCCSDCGNSFRTHFIDGPLNSPTSLCALLLSWLIFLSWTQPRLLVVIKDDIMRTSITRVKGNIVYGN